MEALYNTHKLEWLESPKVWLQEGFLAKVELAPKMAREFTESKSTDDALVSVGFTNLIKMEELAVLLHHGCCGSNFVRRIMIARVALSDQTQESVIHSFKFVALCQLPHQNHKTDIPKVIMPCLHHQYRNVAFGGFRHSSDTLSLSSSFLVIAKTELASRWLPNYCD